MPIDWTPLIEILDAHQRFVISSHVKPDGDAIGSEIGLAFLLEQRGKTVRIVNDSPSPSYLLFLDPERRVLQLGQNISAEEVADTDVHIVVDTSAWGQLANLGPVLRRSPAKKIVIDHHVSSDDLGAVDFKDTAAEATGALIFKLGEALGARWSPQAATALYCAIATDTGWFRFPSTTSETLRIGAQLIDAGVRPHLVYEELYEQYSLGRVLLSGRILSRVALECNGRAAHTYARWDDFEKTGSQPADTENLVNECLRIAGTECAFIAVEQQNRQVKFSFRSRVGLDVARLAEQFGGGGHKQAAGATLPGPFTTAQSKVLAAVRETLGC